MATTANKRPRVARKERVQLPQSDAPIYVQDNTQNSGKRRVSAAVMASMRDNKRQPSFIEACNDLFPARKVWRMFVKWISKSKALFTYRDKKPDTDFVAFNCQPVGDVVNRMRSFCTEQRMTLRYLQILLKRKARTDVQALRVA